MSGSSIKKKTLYYHKSYLVNMRSYPAFGLPGCNEDGYNFILKSLSIPFQTVLNGNTQCPPLLPAAELEINSVLVV